MSEVERSLARVDATARDLYTKRVLVASGVRCASEIEGWAWYEAIALEAARPSDAEIRDIVHGRSMAIGNGPPDAGREP